MAYVGKSNEISNGGQDVVMTELGVFNGHKIKLDIRSDAYKFQSHARAYVWSPVDMKWNLVWSIHYGVMQTAEGLKYKMATRKDFEKDRDTLLSRVVDILS